MTFFEKAYVPKGIIEMLTDRKVSGAQKWVAGGVVLNVAHIIRVTQITL